MYVVSRSDKEKKHKKKLSLAGGNISTLLSSPSSSAKNAGVKKSPGATPSNLISSANGSAQATNNVVSDHSSPVKQLNTSQLSSEGELPNGTAGSMSVEKMSGTLADTSQNASLQNGIQSNDVSMPELPEPTLPQCLPTDVESCILRLKQAGADGNKEGKCKFFNPAVNHMLLE